MPRVTKKTKVTQKQSVNVSVKIGSRRRAPTTRPKPHFQAPTIIVNSHFPQPFHQPPPAQQAPIQTAQTPLKAPTREFSTVTEPVVAPDVTMEEAPVPVVVPAAPDAKMEEAPMAGTKRRRDEATGSMTPDFGRMRRPELLTHLRGPPHHLRDMDVRSLRVGELEELASRLHNNLRIQ